MLKKSDRKPYLIIRVAKDCGHCKHLEEIKFFDWLLPQLSKDFDIRFSEVEHRVLGDPELPAIFNYPTFVPYFMVMLPEIYDKIDQYPNTPIDELVHQVRFFNAIVGPTGEFMILKSAARNEDVIPFCYEAVKSLESMKGLGKNSVPVKYSRPHSKTNFKG